MSELNKNNFLSNEEPDFGLPENYFQNSANAIRNKIEWQDEHAEFNKLLALKTAKGSETHGFETPPYYFHKLSVLSELVAYSNLYTSKKENYFKVPENYFSDRSSKALNSYLKKDSHTEADSAIETKGKGARIIPLVWQRVSMAIAAVLLISFGFWIFKQNEPRSELNDCKTIACIEEQTLLNNLSSLNFENEDLYELVNPIDLQKELEMNSENNQSESDTDHTNSNIEDF